MKAENKEALDLNLFSETYPNNYKTLTVHKFTTVRFSKMSF